MSEEFEKKMTAKLNECYSEIMAEIPQLELFGKTLVPIEYMRELLTRNIQAQAAIKMMLLQSNVATVTPDRLLDFLRFISSTLQGDEGAISEQEGEQKDA